MKKLETVEEVKAAYSEAQIERWIMVGYRQWFKRQNRKPMVREAQANRELKKMSKEQIQVLAQALKKKFHK